MNPLLGHVNLDAHARPPESLRVLFKKWQKTSPDLIDDNDEILDLRKLDQSQQSNLRRRYLGSASYATSAFAEFLGKPPTRSEASNINHELFELIDIPGLYIYPSLLPLEVQAELLNKLFHRDLSNPEHQTNLHLHYNVEYPPSLDQDDVTYPSGSFFTMPQNTSFSAKDPQVHKPLTMEQILQRKLRWITLGGQYDWTEKVYPNGVPPDFPSDISKLLRNLFPDVNAQAAIVNLYSPGDTLSVHRDVSEHCDRGLISISIGCDGLFLIGNSDGTRAAVIRLRSGDAVLMSGQSRFAWHAVPKILSKTCPGNIQIWPAMEDDNTFDQWRGWLSNKRINLNVRQVQVESSD